MKKIKRLKIAEQLIIVITLALIIPLVIAAIIIININQHAVRKELIYSANIIADSIYSRLIIAENAEQKSLKNTAIALSFIKNSKDKEKLINSMVDQKDGIEKIEILKITDEKFKNSDFHYEYDPNKKIIFVDYKIDSNNYLRKYVNLSLIKEGFLKDINPEQREIYILDQNKNLLMSINYNQERLREIISYMPKKYIPGESVIFHKIKNQPNVVIQTPDLNWFIIVSTPRHVISYGIVYARYKIILTILIAAFAVFLFSSGYIYSLYTNIRQLFKGMAAISIGNYSRKIRLIRNIFTPYETIYIANEFNKMAEKIDESYAQLRKKNKKLKKMDEYKSNLIDTVSHEFRTPLTSIKGYTSRLLRHDVQIDEETRRKSLKVIKQQSERLGRLVEDLLVIPDIESSTLNMTPQELHLKDIIETSLYSTTKMDSDVFALQISDNIPNIFADPDRLEQIFINLFENAIKYSKENSKITIKASNDEDFAIVKIHNECEKISPENLEKLFGKFSRLDDNMTRTTRGTGLGLFIVKGLIEAMNGKITLNSDDGFEATLFIPLNKNNEIDEIDENDDEYDS